MSHEINFDTIISSYLFLQLNLYILLKQSNNLYERHIILNVIINFTYKLCEFAYRFWSELEDLTIWIWINSSLIFGSNCRRYRTADLTFMHIKKHPIVS